MEYPEVPDPRFNHVGYMWSEKYEELKAMVKERMKSYNDPSHDFRHIERVIENAYQIYNISRFGTITQFYAIFDICMIHDMFDCKFFTTDEEYIKMEEKLVVLLQEISRARKDDKLWLDEYYTFAVQRIRVAQNISWRKYHTAEGKIDFKTYRKQWSPLHISDASYDNGDMQRWWQVVSLADWMDAQLIIRTIDHCKHVRFPNEIEEDKLKEEVFLNWHEKLIFLPKFKFTLLNNWSVDRLVREKMEKRKLQEAKLLYEWLGEDYQKFFPFERIITPFFWNPQIVFEEFKKSKNDTEKSSI